MSEIITRLLLKTDNFDKNITGARKQIGGFEKSIGSMASKAGKAMLGFGAAVGASVGTLEALNKTIAGSQTLTDSFGAKMEQAKSSVNTFFNAIAMGDFSNFTTRMREAIGLAKDYYLEMDRLGSMDVFQDTSIAQIQNQMQKERNILKNKNSSKEDIAASQARLVELENKLTKITEDYKNQANATYLKGLQKIVAEQGGGNMSDADLLKTFGSFEEYEKITNRYAELNKQVAASREAVPQRGPNGKYTHTAYVDTPATLAITESQEYKNIRAISEAGDELLTSVKGFQRKALQAESVLLAAESANSRGFNRGGGGGGKVTSSEAIAATPPPQGSMAWIDTEITTARQAVANAVGIEAQVEAQRFLDALEDKKVKLQIEIDDRIASGKEIENAVEKFAKGNGGNKIDMSFLNFNGEENPIESELNFSDKVKGVSDYTDSLYGVANAMSAISGATNDGASAWLSWGAGVLGAVGAAIPAITALTAAKNTEATANAASAVTGAASSVASIPVVGWVMAGAAVAAMIASFASMPKFATGGIVPGSSYTGDKVLARLNSGEMVLNRNQQGKLFNSISGGSRSDGASSVNVSVEGRLKGNDILLAVKRQQKQNNRMARQTLQINNKGRIR